MRYDLFPLFLVVFYIFLAPPPQPKARESFPFIGKWKVKWNKEECILTIRADGDYDIQKKNGMHFGQWTSPQVPGKGEDVDTFVPAKPPLVLLLTGSRIGASDNEEDRYRLEFQVGSKKAKGEYNESVAFEFEILEEVKKDKK